MLPARVRAATPDAAIHTFASLSPLPSSTNPVAIRAGYRVDSATYGALRIAFASGREIPQPDAPVEQWQPPAAAVALKNGNKPLALHQIRIGRKDAASPRRDIEKPDVVIVAAIGDPISSGPISTA